VGTIFHSEYGEQGVYRTDSAQIPAESENRKMKFPVVIRHRSEKTKIYGKTPAYPFYRLAYKAAGQRHVRSFKTYSEARREGDHVVRDLAQGSQAAALTTGQAANALTALELLQGFRQQALTKEPQPPPVHVADVSRLVCSPGLPHGKPPAARSRRLAERADGRRSD
jgi:hypothetical protein